MKNLKLFGKYILIVIAIYVISTILIFIGLNINYSDITLNDSLPEQISIEKAEATSTDVRIYGYISNTGDYDLVGSYIKVSIYDSEGEILTTEYLKIDGVSRYDEKLFKVNSNVDNASSYSISIVDTEGE